jgi:hypothetical protein
MSVERLIPACNTIVSPDPGSEWRSAATELDPHSRPTLVTLGSAGGRADQGNPRQADPYRAVDHPGLVVSDGGGGLVLLPRRCANRPGGPVGGQRLANRPHPQCPRSSHCQCRRVYALSDVSCERTGVEMDELPIYRARQVPEHLMTLQQLREQGLRPVDPDRANAWLQLGLFDRRTAVAVAPPPAVVQHVSDELAAAEWAHRDPRRHRRGSPGPREHRPRSIRRPRPNTASPTSWWPLRTFPGLAT